MDAEQIIFNSEFHERQAAITKLLNKLEQDRSFEGREAQLLKDSVDDLISQISDNQIDFQSDLKAILESFRNGLITPEMLERMVRDEQMRSDFLIRIANTIAGELEALFMQVEKLTEYTMPPDMQDSMTMKMQAVMDSVDLFSELVMTPGKKVRNAVLKAKVALEKSAVVPVPIVTPEVIVPKQPVTLPQLSPVMRKGVSKRRAKDKKEEKEEKEEIEEPPQQPARPAPVRTEPDPANEAAAIAAAMAAASAAAAKKAPKPFPVARTTLSPPQRAITPEPKLRIVAKVECSCQTEHSGPIPSSQPIIVQAAAVPKPPSKPVITVASTKQSGSKKGALKADDSSEGSIPTSVAPVPVPVPAPAPAVSAPAPAPAKAKKKEKGKAAAPADVQPVQEPQPIRRNSTKLSQTDDLGSKVEMSCGTEDDLGPQPPLPTKEVQDTAAQTSRAASRASTRGPPVTDSLDDEEEGEGIMLLPPEEPEPIKEVEQPEPAVDHEDGGANDDPPPPSQNEAEDIVLTRPATVPADRPLSADLQTLTSLNLQSEDGDNTMTNIEDLENAVPDIEVPPPRVASPERPSEAVSETSSRREKPDRQAKTRSSFNSEASDNSGWIVNTFGLATKGSVSTSSSIRGKQLEFEALRGQANSQAVGDIITWLEQVDVALGQEGTLFPDEISQRKQVVLEQANKIMRLYTVLEEREKALANKAVVLEKEIKKRVTERIAKEILSMRKGPRDASVTANTGIAMVPDTTTVPPIKRTRKPQHDEFDYSSDEDDVFDEGGGGGGGARDKEAEVDSGDEEEVKLKKRLRRVRRRRLRARMKCETATSIRIQPPEGANKLLLTGTNFTYSKAANVHPHQRFNIQQHALFPIAPPPIRTDGIAAAETQQLLAMRALAFAPQENMPQEGPIGRVMSAMTDRFSLGSPSSRPMSGLHGGIQGIQPLIQIVPPPVKAFSTKETSTEDLSATVASIVRGINSVTVVSRPGSPSASVADPGNLGSLGSPGRADVNHLGVESSSIMELKVQDFGNGLTARSYRLREVKNFARDLAKADNPLMAIYNEYRDNISEIQRARLLRAASTGENATYEYNLELIKNIFGPFAGPLKDVDDTLVNSLLELSLCEKIASNLLTIYDSADLANELFNQSLLRMKSKMGQIEILILWVELQLVEFRAVFEEIRVKNFAKSPGLLQSSKEFDASLQLFVAAQGHLVELKHRMGVLKARSSKFNMKPVGPDIFINEPVLGGGASTGGGGGGSMFDLQSKLLYVGMPSMSQQSGAAVSEVAAAATAQRVYDAEERCLKLEEEVTMLTNDLKEAEAEIKDLTEQLFEADLEQDRTPGTLMFFSALHDPNIIPSMQQMLLQLTQLKGLADCTTHMDFTTLRKRLLVCCNAAPVLDSFIRRFQNMHKNWVRHRLNVFTVRNVAGGDADAANICPVCSIDIREPAAAESRAASNAPPVKRNVPTSHYRSQYSKHPQIFPSRGAKRLEKIGYASVTDMPSVSGGGGGVGGGAGSIMGRTTKSQRQSMPVLLPPMSNDALRNFASLNLSGSVSPSLMSQSLEL